LSGLSLKAIKEVFTEKAWACAETYNQVQIGIWDGARLVFHDKFVVEYVTLLRVFTNERELRLTRRGDSFVIRDTKDYDDPKLGMKIKRGMLIMYGENALIEGTEGTEGIEGIEGTEGTEGIKGTEGERTGASEDKSADGDASPSDANSIKAEDSLYESVPIGLDGYTMLSEDRGGTIYFPKKLKFNQRVEVKLGIKNFYRYNKVPVCPKGEAFDFGMEALSKYSGGPLEVCDYAYEGFYVRKKPAKKGKVNL
jgi:hypothetical protein